ncbi:hypothetical protein ABN68_004654, partial [Salmonella enterica subsp. enterica serovar Adabraka]|nr:hypothetical protein [Salmonella enterica subsp. enterica serovar Wangata]EHA9182254.1 hypothetical protein [Salmonella enterica subsp. enterica serovar Adabraka]
TPVGAPISPPAEPWTIGPPSAVISFWRAAGFPLMLNSFCYLLISSTCNCTLYLLRLYLL